MTPEEVDKARNSVDYWFRHFGVVLDQATLQPITCPEPTTFQKRLFAEYDRRLAMRERMSFVGCKNRGDSGSTSAEACVYHFASNFQVNVAIVGNKMDTANNMLDIFDTFYQHDAFFPRYAGTEITESIDGRRTFGHKSQLRRFTAGNPESVRSWRIQCRHSTEGGRWADDGARAAQKTEESLDGGLPKGGGMYLVLDESTPGNESFREKFHNGCWPDGATWWHKWATDMPQNVDVNAGTKQALRIFAASFEGWRNYERPKDPKEAADRARHIQQTLDKEKWYEGEKELLERYGNKIPTGPLTGEIRLGDEISHYTAWEYFDWRRQMIASNEFKYNLNAFKREYATNPRECFEAATDTVFWVPNINLWDGERHLKTVETGVIVPNDSGVAWQPEPRGWLKVMSNGHPMPGRKYIMTWDPAENKELVKDSGTKDNHGILVASPGFVDQNGSETKNQVPAIIDADSEGAAEMARRVHLVSRYFHCPIVLETNNTAGGACREALENLKANIWHRTESIANGKSTKLIPGWLTNENTRRTLVEKGVEAVFDETWEIYHEEIITQMKTFVWKANGRAEHEGTSHDDFVLAWLIANHLLTHAVEYRDCHRLVIDPDRPRRRMPRRLGGQAWSGI